MDSAKCLKTLSVFFRVSDYLYSWMRFHFGFPKLVFLACLASGAAVAAPITPEQVAQLPSPANHAVDFAKEIKPIFEASCIKCHGRGRDKGGLRLDTRGSFLKGGDSGPAVLSGNSAQSL